MPEEDKGNTEVHTARARYKRLEIIRSPYLRRARACSVLTIPALIPPEGSTGTTDLPAPYQALGARGVNNLASKLLITLLPPNAPFFKLVVDDFVLQEMTGQEGLRAQVEEAFNSMERAVMTEVETSAIRPAVFESLKHLLVGGNVATFLNPQGGMKVFPLDRYVCKRDPMGKLLELITREQITIEDLPEDFRANITADSGSVNKELNGEKTIGLYTVVRREGKRWFVHQEAGGKVIPNTQGNYPEDKSPFSVLRFVAIAGEDYGRGFVEEYKGDIQSLEFLTKAIVQGSSAAAKVLFMLSPSAVTESTDITESESGDIIIGRADDVSVLQMEKQADFQVAANTISRLEQGLGLAFLLNTSIQRNGERVTAEEIRFMANELENALGGIYSNLSQEFQLPLVTVLMARMERQKKLPVLPKGVVRPQVTTGVDAIGRGQDSEKLRAWLDDISVLGPDVVAANIVANDYIKRSGVARGIDMKGLVKTPDQLKADAEAARARQLTETLGPNIINQAGKLTGNQQNINAQSQSPESGEIVEET